MSRARTAVLAAAMAIGVTVSGCGSRGAGTAPAPPDVVHAATEVVGLTPISERYEAVGTVNPKISSVLSSKTTGQVLAVHVREGDRVRAGQVLVEIDARDAAAQAAKASAWRTEAERSLDEVDRSITAAEQSLAAAEAQARLATVTHGRYAQLLEHRAISRQEYDEAEARRDVAVAQVASAKSTIAAMRARRRAGEARIVQAGADVAAAAVVLSYPKVTAPFDGVVTRRSVEAGTLATPGTPLLTIEDERVYRLEASVEEAFARAVSIGDVVPVTLAALGEARLEGRVAEVGPSADPASRTVTVKIDLPRTPGLRSGVYGRAVFSRGERMALTVARSALVERGQVVSVYVVDERGTAHVRVVTAGRESGDRVEVLSGLAEGDRVVVDGARGLAEGRAIAEISR
jgi:multidrug efflux pump subunit AcrA (membrane-fusion protein)